MVPFGDGPSGRSAAGCGERRSPVFAGNVSKAAGWPGGENKKLLKVHFSSLLSGERRDVRFPAKITA
jgi:hypothetical protein